MTTLPIGVAPIWRLTIDQYHSMIENGILVDDDPVELLEGVLVQRPRKTPLHCFVTSGTRRALDRIAPLGWYVDTYAPITLAGSEPEPDVAVIRGDTRDYSIRHPGPADVGLVVEVSDASLERDRVLKKRIYAMGGIPKYWLFDVAERSVEVYSEPKSGDYPQCAIYGPDDSVPVTLDGSIVGDIPVSSLLP